MTRLTAVCAAYLTRCSSFHAFGMLITAALMQDQFRGSTLAVRDEGDLRIHNLEEGFSIAFREDP